MVKGNARAAGPAGANGEHSGLCANAAPGSLELRECIGQGSFAKVFRAAPHAAAGRQRARGAEPAAAPHGAPHGAVALKALDRTRLTPKAVQMLAQEVRVPAWQWRTRNADCFVGVRA